MLDYDSGHLTVLDVANASRVLLETDGVPAEALVTFSRDGGAVTAVRRDAMRLWDLADGRERLSLRVPGVELTEARYEPGSGELLLMQTRGGALWRLLVEVDSVIPEVCADPGTRRLGGALPGVPEQPLCPCPTPRPVPFADRQPSRQARMVVGT